MRRNARGDRRGGGSRGRPDAAAARVQPAGRCCQPQVLSLNAVVAQTSTRCWGGVIGEDIELRLSLSDRTSGSVKADPGQIEQVLLNLAVNARDAMPDGRHADDRDLERRAGRRATAGSTSARGRAAT